MLPNTSVVLVVTFRVKIKGRMMSVVEGVDPSSIFCVPDGSGAFIWWSNRVKRLMFGSGSDIWWIQSFQHFQRFSGFAV